MKHWHWLLALVFIVGGLCLLKTSRLTTKKPPLPVQENHLTVLCYHHVDQEKGLIYNLSSNALLSQLNYLTQSGYVFVSMQEIDNFCYQGKPLPAKAVAITFDDGNLNVYTAAYPLLKAKNIPFAVFIYPTAINCGHRKGFMNWHDVKILAKDPLVTVGSHSYDHPFLTDYYKQKRPEEWLEKQLVASKLKIEQELALPIDYFAVPYGAWDQVIYNRLKTANYKLVFNVNGTNNCAQFNPLNINRLIVFSYDTLHTFKEKVNIKALPLINQTPPDLSVVTDNILALSFLVEDLSGKFQTDSVSLSEYHTGKLQPTLIIENMYKKNILLKKKGFYLIKVKASDAEGEEYCGSWFFLKR